jgi:glycerol-3-phosphate acyltransferase PlsY
MAAVLLVGTPLLAFVASYLIGSIPFAYIIVKAVTGEDITQHGTGNVGAMNVRRSTGSWGWFVVDMLADGLKGLVPVALAKLWVGGGSVAVLLTPMSQLASSADGVVGASMLVLVQAALAGAVLGHNYSVWMAIIKGGFHRTGKGLATGAGALLAYDWRYFVIVLVVGLATIAITRYMMAGQVAAAASLPTGAIVTGSSDSLFCLIMASIVIAAHWKRFVGMLRGQEPRLYVNDRMGPRG